MIKSINIEPSIDSTNLELHSPTIDIQKIVIKNIATPAKISMSGKTNCNEIQIANTECVDTIKVGPRCPYKKDIEVALNQAIPKSLSLFPHISEAEILDTDARSKGKIFVDLDGKESVVTLDDLKKMNTKTLLVDDISDKQVDLLSEYDFILVSKN